MTPALHSDAASRARIRESLGESLLVEASAGTGKTTEMIARIVNVLAAGRAAVDRIVAVTFTHKAAGEMKIRLRDALDRKRRAAASVHERERIEDALERLEEAAIGTIHGFCAQILRERPVEARIDPEFTEATESEAGALFERAFDRWFQEALAAGAPGLKRALARMAWPDGREGLAPAEQLAYAGWKLIEWRDFRGPWTRRPFDRVAEIERLVREIELLAECANCGRDGDPLRRSLEPVCALHERLKRAARARPERDYDQVEALLIRLAADLKADFRRGRGHFSDGLPREQVAGATEALLQGLAEFRRASSADLAALLQSEMQGLIDGFAEIKRRSGKLDFTDLLLLVRDLIAGNPEVRGYLQRRYDCIFVDEFQDTDPLQAEILLLLAADDAAETDWRRARPIPGKLFLVGDPKQSIYRFRRADVGLYRQIAAQLESAGVGRVALSKSFRSVRPIQQFVNAAFEPEMRGDEESAQAQYSPLEEHHPGGAQPAIVALPVPKPYGNSEKYAKYAIDACLPDTVAAYVEWLVTQSGWSVRDPQTGEPAPLRPRHICVLFRRFLNFGEDITRPYVHSLEARGIPHLLVGSKSFHSREEVETLRAAITAIEWPEDELAVFATLRGALFAIPDELLFRYRHEHGRLHPFRRVENADAEYAPVEAALAALADLHRGRNRRPIADTVNELLEVTRAWAGFALRPAGAQVLANVLRIADLARAFESGGGLSFRGFAEALSAEAEKVEAMEAPVLEQASDGVRLMTVHGAKGLEFPVVILADITCNIAQREPERAIDAGRNVCALRLLRHCSPWDLLDAAAREGLRDHAEGVRVAYVAATRARDLLVVPAPGDYEFAEGWLHPLNRALYPAPDRYRTRQEAPECPAFRGDRTVMMRSRGSYSSQEDSIHPGLHQPRSGGHSVVWWDPLTLRRDVEPNFGGLQIEVLKEEPRERAETAVRRYDDWSRGREELLRAGAQPSLRIFTATEADANPPEDYPVTLVHVEGSRERPGGMRFGTLVHQLLRDAEPNAGKEDAGEEQLRALAAVQGRLLAARPDERASAVAAALAALRHPLVDGARAAGQVRRELPVVLPLGEGRTLEGVIDLAYETAGKWVVIDFKTDAALASTPARYLRQVKWYCYALARLTGQPVEGFLLAV